MPELSITVQKHQDQMFQESLDLAWYLKEMLVNYRKKH